MTEFGSKSLIQGGDGVDKQKLPGVKEGNLSSRNFKAEVRVSKVQFSPTGIVPSIS